MPSDPLASVNSNEAGSGRGGAGVGVAHFGSVEPAGHLTNARTSALGDTTANSTEWYKTHGSVGRLTNVSCLHAESAMQAALQSSTVLIFED